ncbi:MAG: 30S ribosomal protein S3 [candidate division Zixibacteria bacterium]|nr:30S ribosomal protein S3 [candidate division Zixibacteria bacterium]
MGQKTNPIGLRLGIIRTWNSRWFAPQRNFADLVHEDILVKRYINKRLDNAGISNVIISRAPKKVTVDIMTSRPGIVIGRRGAEVDKLREELQMLTKKDIMLNIVEVRKPELDARLVGDSVARQLEGRVSFRRAMKKAIAATMKMGAQGVKIQCGGRLGGAEIARTEKYREGRVPLHTLRADIDYATSTAVTTYGCIGVKVWICRGEILEMGQYGLPGENAAVQQDQSAQGEPVRRPDQGRGGGRDRRGKRPRGRVRRHDGAPVPGGQTQDNRPPHGRRPERPAPPRSGGSNPTGGTKS